MKRPYLWVLLPAIVGLLLAFLIDQFSTENPVFYMRASLSVLIFFLSVIVSIVVALIFWQSKQKQNATRLLNEARGRSGGQPPSLFTPTRS